MNLHLTKSRSGSSERSSRAVPKLEREAAAAAAEAPPLPGPTAGHERRVDLVRLSQLIRWSEQSQNHGQLSVPELLRVDNADRLDDNLQRAWLCCPSPCRTSALSSTRRLLGDVAVPDCTGRGAVAGSNPAPATPKGPQTASLSFTEVAASGKSCKSRPPLVRTAIKRVGSLPEVEARR